MKKQSTAIWASVLLVLTAILLGSLVQFTHYDGDREQEIQLPSDGGGSTGDSDTIAGQNKALLETVTLSADNVRTVLRQLVRPLVYHWESRILLYSGGVAGESLISADVSNGMIRVSRRGVGGKRLGEFLLTPGAYYAWEEGETQYYSGKREDFTDDQLMLSFAYEELLDPEKIRITEAGPDTAGEKSGILVRGEDLLSGYHLEYILSVEDGMLLSVTAKDGDTLCYRIERIILEMGVVNGSAFTLPDGTTPEQ